jgi:hypothetical protein
MLEHERPVLLVEVLVEADRHFRHRCQIIGPDPMSRLPNVRSLRWKPPLLLQYGNFGF